MRVQLFGCILHTAAAVAISEQLPEAMFCIL